MEKERKFIEVSNPPSVKNTLIGNTGEYPGKNLSDQSRVKNQQTKPTYDDAESGDRTRAPLVRGDCSQHYNITALRKSMNRILIIPDFS